MTVANYSQLRTAQIRPLAELLPLDTPLSMMVDPSNVCNFKCVFCPTGDHDALARVQRPVGMMTLELFRKIVDDLAAFPQPLQVLHLYKDGEPLVNKQLEAMVACAKASGRVKRVELTTNGSLLTPQRAEGLIRAGLDGLRVSIYALDDAGYRDVAQTRTRFETIRHHVQELHRLKLALRPDFHIHVKTIDTGFTESQRSYFHGTFRPIADTVFIDSLVKWYDSEVHDISGMLKPELNLYGQKAQPRRVCAEPFMKLVVNFNGAVSVCCVDWSLGTVVGDVSREPLRDIWLGEPLRTMRLAQLRGCREDYEACRNCQYPKSLPAVANLDAEVGRLLAAYEPAAAAAG